MTLLSDILKGINLIEVEGSIAIPIAGLAIDSRKVKANFLFAAIAGTSQDGHDFIQQAIDRGAAAILCESLPNDMSPDVCYLKVASSNNSMAYIARNYFDNPVGGMQIIGITGTNGKTTVATLCFQLAQKLGYKAGLFSTVEVRIGAQRLKATHTTPDFIQLYARLREMKDAGCAFVFMEVSSHALDQNRLKGLPFDIGVFTNVTRDHLDYHGDFKSYIDAKKLLFDRLDKTSSAIICKDDKHADYMVQNCAAKIRTYGLRSFGDIHGRVIENSIHGLTMQLNGKEISFQISGAYNAQNLLATYGVFECLGFSEDELLEKWSTLRGAEGRFDQIRSAEGVIAIVDYAHTPDALANVLRAINELQKKQTTTITVVGCGGDRDKGKRPLMAKIASENSELVILTSDNPRSEDPQEIVNEMYAGIAVRDQNKTFKIVDREEAIKLACQLAKNGDIILVAGKGHEKYQEIKGEKFPFDDKQVLQQYLSIVPS